MLSLLILCVLRIANSNLHHRLGYPISSFCTSNRLREWLREGLHIADAWIVLLTYGKLPKSGGYDNSHLFFHLPPHAARKCPVFFAPTPMAHDIPSEKMQELYDLSDF